MNEVFNLEAHADAAAKVVKGQSDINTLRATLKAAIANYKASNDFKDADTLQAFMDKLDANVLNKLEEHLGAMNTNMTTAHDNFDAAFNRSLQG